MTNPESQSTAVGSPTNASNPQHQNTITSTTSGGSAGRAGGGISFDLHTPPAQQDASAQERRESLWVSMGVHRSNDGGGSTIRKRRMSKQRESLELPTAEQMQNLEDMGEFFWKIEKSNYRM